VVGFAQVLALIPGTSRSGITMTAARFCGFERTDAARFSMLLAIPAILGAATLAGWDLYQLGNLRLGLDAAMAAAMALVAALVAIAVLMNWLSHATFTPFVVYRIVLGGVLFYLIYHEPVHGWFGP
jgi:undecaprenyl-diphosphatase